MKSKTLGGLIMAGAIVVGAPAALALASPDAGPAIHGQGSASVDAIVPGTPSTSVATDAAQAQEQTATDEASAVVSTTSQVRVPDPRPQVNMKFDGSAVQNGVTSAGNAAAQAKATAPSPSGETSTTVVQEPAPRPADNGSGSGDVSVSINGAAQAGL